MDASGMQRALTRLCGRAPRGERVVDTVTQHSGPTVTLSGALSLQGLEAVLPRDGATEGAVVQASVAPGLGPTLVAGAIVILENWSAHTGPGSREALESPGAHVVDVPPSSPDLSPLERCWSQVTTALRKAKARTREALEHALEQVLSTVTAVDARHWFAHCGYAAQ
jgi:hypothetical protein